MDNCKISGNVPKAVSTGLGFKATFICRLSVF